ncbi:unnamed protein product [Adineta steineri]|uniref:WAP domain-containing protein n=1 Tax=Adineta steineri TaxID=433720 RepID=A0A818V1C0_9BILA|nr:unnamed protein product [Adineta steineri]CAF0795214.1 unnamed protein product [Adineta steineri]CAF3705985.1 unnamed protein product [Adineta steineri]CAF3724903.1 unnamed protein product [Adineta steineri]
MAEGIMCYFSTVILFFIVISFINTEKICPGYGFVKFPENCTLTCSTSNDQCTNGTKCCQRLTEPCGFHCIKPKDDVKKSGDCPQLQANNPFWFLCDGHYCDVDSDCKGMAKCCTNICRSKICVIPHSSK